MFKAGNMLTRMLTLDTNRTKGSARHVLRGLLLGAFLLTVVEATWSRKKEDIKLLEVPNFLGFGINRPNPDAPWYKQLHEMVPSSEKECHKITDYTLPKLKSTEVMRITKMETKYRSVNSKTNRDNPTYRGLVDTWIGNETNYALRHVEKEFKALNNRFKGISWALRGIPDRSGRDWEAECKKALEPRLQNPKPQQPKYDPKAASKMPYQHYPSDSAYTGSSAYGNQGFYQAPSYNAPQYYNANAYGNNIWGHQQPLGYNDIVIPTAYNPMSFETTYHDTYTPTGTVTNEQPSPETATSKFALRAKPLTSSDKEWKPLTKGMKCQTKRCRTLLNKKKQRHHCRQCGNNICQNCTLYMKLKKPEHGKTLSASQLTDPNLKTITAWDEKNSWCSSARHKIICTQCRDSIRSNKDWVTRRFKISSSKK